MIALVQHRPRVRSARRSPQAAASRPYVRDRWRRRAQSDAARAVDDRGSRRILAVAQIYAPAHILRGMSLRATSRPEGSRELRLRHRRRSEATGSLASPGWCDGRSAGSEDRGGGSIGLRIPPIARHARAVRRGRSSMMADQHDPPCGLCGDSVCRSLAPSARNPRFALCLFLSWAFPNLLISLPPVTHCRDERPRPTNRAQSEIREIRATPNDVSARSATGQGPTQSDGFREACYPPGAEIRVPERPTSWRCSIGAALSASSPYSSQSFGMSAALRLSAQQPPAQQPPAPPPVARTPGAPEGEVIKAEFDRSQVYPGTWREYWVYVPKQLDRDEAGAGDGLPGRHPVQRADRARQPDSREDDSADGRRVRDARARRARRTPTRSIA